MSDNFVFRSVDNNAFHYVISFILDWMIFNSCVTRVSKFTLILVHSCLIFFDNFFFYFMHHQIRVDMSNIYLHVFSPKNYDYILSLNYKVCIFFVTINYGNKNPFFHECYFWYYILILGRNYFTLYFFPRHNFFQKKIIVKLKFMIL